MNYNRIKKSLGVLVVSSIIALQLCPLKAGGIAGRIGTGNNDNLQQFCTLQKSLHNAVAFTAKANR